MRKHIIIIAIIFLFLGISMAAIFISVNMQFFSVSSSLFAQSSVTDGNLSFFSRWYENFNIYMNFFKRLGANPLVGLYTIISSIVFGYGLLKSKEWARMLGLALTAINAFISIYELVTGKVSVAIILQIALCGYMFWVLTSKETINLMKGNFIESE